VLRPKGLIFCSSDLNVPNNIRFSILNGILKRSIMTELVLLLTMLESGLKLTVTWPLLPLLSWKFIPETLIPSTKLIPAAPKAEDPLNSKEGLIGFGRRMNNRHTNEVKSPQKIMITFSVL
jgi:hypothetical protein